MRHPAFAESRLFSLMAQNGLVELRIDDIPVATPIEWTLFDDDGNVAFRPGFVFRGRQQIVELLRTTALFRADQKPGQAPVREVAASRRHPHNTPTEGETTLDEIGLHIGESWQLQAVSDFDQTRHYVTLIGYIQGVSVIVTAPVVDDKAILIREGQNFIVRAFSGKSAYAFKTSVLRALNWPLPYLHLSYPEKVSGLVVRAAQRVDVSIIASVVPARGGEPLAAMIKNVSKAGVSLDARAPLGAIGDAVSMSFRLDVDGHEHLLVLNGLIRAIRAPSGAAEESTEYGAQIVNPQPLDQLVLTAFVNSHLAHA